MSNGSGQERDFPEEEMDIGLSCTLDMFREYKEVHQMISDIPLISGKEILAEKSFEKLEAILKQYQEQPHLLDPHLQTLLNQLISLISDTGQNKSSVSLAFQYLWKIVKVRGYKIVMKKMPHEVKDLITVLNMLEKEDLRDDFYRSYILLMWLAIIVYMPFSMTIFNSSESSEKSKTVVDRILEIIKSHLNCAQSSREMAAYLASRFVTRPDLKEKYLRDFITYCFEVIETSDPRESVTLFHKMGVLRTLGLIFKHGKREELIDYSSEVIQKLSSPTVRSKIDDPLKKFLMKLIQRIGLTYLRPKVAFWRYQRGSRSLATNVDKSALPRITMDTLSCNEEEEEEVSSEVEEIIDYLLKGLKDQATVVRWSAAKGIGRVTERLPQSLADEVIEEILQLFSVRESDKAWHGGCLALAELARRGLLLPARLRDVMPILEKALVYDKLKGQFSIGANIRDAACYVCWAFARAYHPDQMGPYVRQIAAGLLIVSLFDREIPCRRAGSAAFQENVGRQGNFPHGIEILTTIDYFAVGNRSNAYLNLSVNAGKFEEYTKAFIDHLVAEKVSHWDSCIRELSAQALHNLTALSPDYMGGIVLPKLISDCTGSILINRHGSILAAGFVIHALFLKAQDENKEFSSYIHEVTFEKVYAVVPSLEAKKLFRGMGGEFMRQAIAVFIEKCSLSRLSLEKQQELLEQWHSLLEDGILNFEENIRSVSLNAIRALWAQYYEMTSEEKVTWRENIIQRYLHGLQNSREMQCLGYTALLGHMPKHLLRSKVSNILEALSSVLKITPNTETWAITRKEAIKSIISISSTVGIDISGDDNECISASNFQKIYCGLLDAMDDYATDRRGDIGSWTREASMQAIQSLTMEVLEKDFSVFLPPLVSEMMTRICQQAVERIDRTRRVAGMVFQALLHCRPALPHVPDVEDIRRIFTPEWCADCNWASESNNYPKFVLLLDFPVYRYRMLLGLTYALGGVSAHLSRYTLEALQSYLNERIDNKGLLLGFMESVLELFNNNKKENRVILPLIKSLSDLLGSCSALDQVLEEHEYLIPNLLLCLKKECVQCNEFNKLAATVTTLCELLRVQSSSNKNIFAHLTIFLGYQYPKVRALTATSFLTALMDYSDRQIVPDETLDEVTYILEDTPWMESMDTARVQRNKICELLGVPVPQLKKKK